VRFKHGWALTSEGRGLGKHFEDLGTERIAVVSERPQLLENPDQGQSLSRRRFDVKTRFACAVIVHVKRRLTHMRGARHRVASGDLSKLPDFRPESGAAPREINPRGLGLP
jgi:hypothetical protein